MVIQLLFGYDRDIVLSQRSNHIMAANAKLSDKDKEFRDFSLQGNMWRVVCYIGLPLALYQSLNQIFKIFDAMMASHISANSVSAITYLSQINMVIAAIGGGLAIGGSIQISSAYGLGDLALVKQRVSSLFALTALLGMIILTVLIPTTQVFLRLAKTPEIFIEEGSRYFILELISTVISFFNGVYIAIERARGNSKRILYLNMGVIAVKLGLTALFVYVLNGTINSIAIATIISQLLLLLAAAYNLKDQNNAFGFSLASVSFQPLIIKPMILLSIPVIMEKMAFSLGKVIVNSMSTIYSPLTVGALGISNTIGGFTTTPQNGFQDGSSALISQSLGADDTRRALKAFRCTLVINVLIGFVLMSLSLLFLPRISRLYAGGNADFARMISEIYTMEALGAVPLGINSAVMALLYGFGKTRLTLLINFSRLFVFRIPLLWFLQQFTDIGNASVGIVMGVSNLCVGTLAVVIAVIQVRKICKEHQLSFFSL